MRFTIRDVLLATVIVAMGFGWWLDHKSMRGGIERERIKFRHALDGLIEASLEEQMEASFRYFESTIEPPPKRSK